jgi:hypothetical protein
MSLIVFVSHDRDVSNSVSKKIGSQLHVPSVGAVIGSIGAASISPSDPVGRNVAADSKGCLVGDSVANGMTGANVSDPIKSPTGGKTGGAVANVSIGCSVGASVTTGATDATTSPIAFEVVLGASVTTGATDATTSPIALEVVLGASVTTGAPDGTTSPIALEVVHMHAVRFEVSNPRPEPHVLSSKDPEPCDPPNKKVSKTPQLIGNVFVGSSREETVTNVLGESKQPSSTPNDEQILHPFGGTTQGIFGQY